MPLRPREFVQHLTPYEWEAMASDVAAAAGIRESEVVRFDTNTAAWPPAAWEQTVLDVPRLPVNEYPHPSNEPLRSALAGRFGVAPEQVVVTCGADEALFLVATAYLGPGRAGVVADPSFSMFGVVTEAAGGRLVKVPVDEDWQLPLAPVLAAAREPSVGVVWLCSPSNPTGRTLADDFVPTLLRELPDVAVVVDEAYAEISGCSIAELVLEAPNGILIRTFSKGYGLAGARVGYVVSNAEVATTLETLRLPQNMTAFGIAAACRALEDQAGLQARVASIVAERTRFSQELAARGWQLVPSSANFLLGSPPRPALEVAAWLQGAGLIVRTYPRHPRLKDWLRVTVRAPEEDDRLLARLDALTRASRDLSQRER
ncbi:MAG: histidinol-phosphate aminotransferase family protein [Chloroflexi bacterium]|nr:histidinol-phosphate aminotransferase family protein [Chloroflexota bacterium]